MTGKHQQPRNYHTMNWRCLILCTVHHHLSQRFMLLSLPWADTIQHMAEPLPSQSHSMVGPSTWPILDMVEVTWSNTQSLVQCTGSLCLRGFMFYTINITNSHLLVSLSHLLLSSSSSSTTTTTITTTTRNHFSFKCTTFKKVHDNVPSLSFVPLFSVCVCQSYKINSVYVPVGESLNEITDSLR